MRKFFVSTALATGLIAAATSANAGVTCNGLSQKDCAAFAVEIYGQLGPLPDGQKPAGFVQTTGPSDKPRDGCIRLKMVGNDQKGGARWSCPREKKVAPTS